MLAYPTSSLRTMYMEGCPFQVKCPIGIRITNCIRTNAQRKLESILLMDRYLQRLQVEHPETFKGMKFVREMAAYSWAPDNHEEFDAAGE